MVSNQASRKLGLLLLLAVGGLAFEPKKTEAECDDARKSDALGALAFAFLPCLSANSADGPTQECCESFTAKFAGEGDFADCLCYKNLTDYLAGVTQAYLNMTVDWNAFHSKCVETNPAVEFHYYGSDLIGYNCSDKPEVTESPALAALAALLAAAALGA